MTRNYPIEQPQRRRVLAAIAAVAGLAAALKSPSVPVGDNGPADLMARLLEALGEDGHQGAVIAHGAAEQYLSRILRTPLSALASNAAEHDLKARLRENIAADYRDGDIRIVDGWWLSATEANCLELIDLVRAA